LDDDILDRIRENFRIYEIDLSDPSRMRDDGSSRKPLKVKYEKTTIEATLPTYGIRYHLICLTYEILRKLRPK